MKEERMKVLEMLQQGKIDAQQAERLLQALETSYQAERAASRPGAAENFKKSVQSVKDFAHRVFSKLPGVKDTAENYGTLTMTNEMLGMMPDECQYTNFGVVTLEAGLSSELLAKKIAGYTNFGSTIGPAKLISVLQGRATNYGSFDANDAPAKEETPAGT